MNNPLVVRIFEILMAAFAAFILHAGILYFAGRWGETRLFLRLPEWVYLFFLTCSIAIVVILLRVKKRNIDSVGQAFLLLTCLKAGAAYAVIHPAMQPGHEFEKLNFFVVFAVFLAIETVVSIRILNKP